MVLIQIAKPAKSMYCKLYVIYYIGRTLTAFARRTSAILENVGRNAAENEQALHRDILEKYCKN